jgi:hypothetical protein
MALCPKTGAFALAIVETELIALVTAKDGMFMTSFSWTMTEPKVAVIALPVRVRFASASRAGAPKPDVIASATAVTLASASWPVVPKADAKDKPVTGTLASASVESELKLKVTATPTGVILALPTIEVEPMELEICCPDGDITAPATGVTDPKADVTARPVRSTSIDKGCPQRPDPQVPLPQPITDYP